jgi:diacylglycerol O-acyltransferase
MSSHTMPAADAVWLHMDRPTNPMVVNGLVMLGGAPDPERVAEALQRRLVDRFPRFRQRIAEPLGRPPAFEDDPSFDLENHLHHITLPEPGDRATLQALIGDLITAPLDRSRPLWHAYLIEGFGESAVVLWRIHHCIADGIALARVLLSIADEGGSGVETSGVPQRGRLGMLADGSRRLSEAAARLGGGAVHEGMESLVQPDHLRELAAIGLRDASAVAKWLASPADPPSDLQAPLTGTRRVAWSTPFPLPRVKEAGRRGDATINDVLVAALAGALHEHFGAEGALPEEIHAAVPFNLRPLDEPVPADLGNDFALILLALPLGQAEPGERLREVHERVEAIKRSHEPLIAYGMLSAIGLTPPWLEDPLIGFFSDKSSLVVTNVPGPRHQARFAGVPVTGVLVWAPCTGSLGMTVSMFSYNGEVSVGFMTDTAVIPEPEPLARAYDEQLRLLCG